MNSPDRPDEETLRDALSRMHRRACGDPGAVYMSIPANPKRDADLLLSAAIDELVEIRRWAARANEELAVAYELREALEAEELMSQGFATSAELVAARERADALRRAALERSR